MGTNISDGGGDDSDEEEEGVDDELPETLATSSVRNVEEICVQATAVLHSKCQLNMTNSLGTGTTFLSATATTGGIKGNKSSKGNRTGSMNIVTASE